MKLNKILTSRVLNVFLIFTLIFTNFSGVLSVPVSASTTSDGLIISEYIEGSSFNKALEIYNGTGADVDLSAYTLEVYFNGKTTTTPISLEGVIANNDVYVVAHTSANDDIKAIADELTGSLSFNGDDAIVLKHNDTIIDSFGQVGVDPGSSWDGLTADNTLVRNASILSGDTNSTDAFDPNIEWDVYDKDTVTNLGSHTIEESDYISVADAIANNAGEATVRGYIVGTVTSSSNFDLEAPFDRATNLGLADSPTETDVSKMIPVQLPSGSVRSALNLVDNPGNHGALVEITGDLETYFSIPGLKSPSAYEIIEGGTTPEPDPTPEPGEVVTIEEARALNNGTQVTVEGVVTADNTAISGGGLSTYIQDDTAGINLYGSSPEDLQEGDKVKVTGSLAEYNGLKEIEPTNIEELSTNEALPQPKEITLADLQDATIAEPLEGQLIKVNGYVQDVPSSPAGGGYNVSFVDAEYNSTTLRVMEGTNAISALEEGKWFEVTAILSQYDTYQILPRKAADITLASEQPEAPTSAGEYSTVVESVTDGDTIHIKTPVLGATKVRFLNMDTPETYHIGDYDMDKVNSDPDHAQKYFGELAKEHIKTLIQPGDEITLKIGQEPTDAYGRLLAQVVRKSDNVNVNLQMVKDGYASTYFIWPVGDEATYNEFQTAVENAKDNKLGIWSDTNTDALELPFVFRAREQGKGLLRYVGNSDTKEYVEPQDWETVDVDKRIFFVSADEAEAQGYVPEGETQQPPSEGTVDVQLLGFNDLHGKIDQEYGFDENDDEVIDYYKGRIDYIASYVKQKEAENPNTLVVHAGDMIGGSSPVSALLQDEPTVNLMESIGFDVGAVGNHEFDEGTVELLRMVNGGEYDPVATPGYDGMDFPLLCANCIDESTNESILPSYTILETAGQKIGFVGLTTSNTGNMVIPEGINGLKFTDGVTEANAAIEELKAEGVETIVVLAHMAVEENGSGEAASLANAIDDEVDVIFAGHNHQVVNTEVDGKLIVEAGEYGQEFSEVDLVIDTTTGDVVSKLGNIVDVDHRNAEPHQPTKEQLEHYLDLVGPTLNEVMGHSTTEIVGGYSNTGDNALGNLLADGMKWAMDSDFALMNGGGIRDSLPKGAITYSDLFNVQPFNNVLVKLEISGSDLREIMNAQITSGYGPDYSIAGFKYTWNPAVNKVVDLMLPDGTPIDPEGEYTVTTNNFMATATGSKYLPIGELGENMITGPEDLEATVDYVKTLPNPFTYEIEGRITGTDEMPPAEEIDTVTIAEARAASIGSEVVVEGVVTSTPGSYGGKNFYVQDMTGGLYVYTTLDEGLKIGDEVRLSGTTDEYNGLFELKPTIMEKTGAGPVVPAKQLTPAQLGEAVEGQLAVVKGATISDLEEKSYGSIEFTATKDGETVSVYVDNRTGLKFLDFAFENGDVVDITGIITDYKGTYELNPRMAEDIEAAETVNMKTVVEARAAAAGEEVTVQGVVTVKAGDTTFIQDETAGIAIYGSEIAASVGDKVQITGTTKDYNGLRELVDFGVTLVEASVGTPAPKSVNSTELGEDLEGQLVTIADITVDSDAGYGEFNASDATGTFVIDNSAFSIESGTSYESITGVLTYDFGSFKVIPVAAPVEKSTPDPEPKQEKVVKPATEVDNSKKEMKATVTTADVENMQDNEVLVLEPENALEQLELSIALNADVIQALVNKNADLKINKGDTQVQIPTAILEQIAAAGGDVVITLEQQEVEGAIGPVYNFTITAGSSEISDFNGEAVTLTFQVDADSLAEMDPNNIKAFYYNETTGEWEVIADSVYDPNTGVITATTTHFSTFGIFENNGDAKDAPVDAEVPDEDTQNPDTGDGSDNGSNPDDGSDTDDGSNDGDTDNGDSDKGSDDESGEELPDTATSTFNLLAIGLFILVGGLGLLFVMNRRKQV
ncbi:DUF6359 domain-containing protein [Radiobacillus sp. PE A8.2]|uniref:DUF6359 domain-containing protein n=1 Tax=Radiobacillus sp. PE A8.2 TaxID=3380349 RepID=UPI00388D10E3